MKFILTLHICGVTAGILIDLAFIVWFVEKNYPAEEKFTEAAVKTQIKMTPSERGHSLIIFSIVYRCDDVGYAHAVAVVNHDDFAFCKKLAVHQYVHHLSGQPV